MDDLLWWEGITWHTPLNEIGWTYVFMILMGGVATALIRKTIREFRK